jgi:hypothetical protein
MPVIRKPQPGAIYFSYRFLRTAGTKPLVARREAAEEASL